MIRPKVASGRLGSVFFVLSLTVSMAASVFPGAAMGVLAPFLIRDLDVSKVQIGALISVFAAAGAVASPWAGRLTDRFGGKRILAFSFAVGGLMLLSVSMASSFAWLFGSMLVAGLVQASGNPATNQVIVLNREPGRRGPVIGIKQSGVQLSYVVAGLLIPLLAVLFGWRSAIAILSLLLFLSIGLALRFPAGSVVHTRAASDAEIDQARSDIRILAWSALFMGSGISSFMGYLPLYAHEQLNFTVPVAGFAVSLIGLMGALFRILWGRVGEESVSLRFLLAGLSLLSAISAGMIWGSQAWIVAFWLGVVAAGASSASWSAVSNIAAIALSDLRSVGRASSNITLGFFTGFAISPVLFGYLVDTTASYAAGWLLIISSFLVAAAILMFLFEKSNTPAPRPE